VHDDQSLLAADEPAAFLVEREDGRSSFFLTCDHAGALVPRKPNSLGVSTEDVRRHIAWDIGARTMYPCASSGIDLRGTISDSASL
jgi:predicted N-formylglutamate amidohydrolase